jgi:hypothetical protein
MRKIGTGQDLGAELAQALAQPLRHRREDANIAGALALGSVAQVDVGTQFRARVQRIEEHPWPFGHLVAGRVQGALVVVEPLAHLARGQAGGQQLAGMRAVGARQRGHHPGGGPGRERT